MKITADQAPVLNHARQSLLADGMPIVLILAFLNFLLHLYFNDQYGYFRDEFDYLACGDHLAWGYVDQPPVVPFLIKISRLLLGDSLRSIRIVPALATSAAVILTADRKSTRLNSSHTVISYAVFCLKKKIKSTTVVT